MNHLIGQRNRLAIERSQILIALLDGQELDSGTASEVGYASGKGKRVYSLRSDFRQAGEAGARVNLQVQYFIEASGGRIATSLAELCTFLTDLGREYSADRTTQQPSTSFDSQRRRLLDAQPATSHLSQRWTTLGQLLLTT